MLIGLNYDSDYRISRSAWPAVIQLGAQAYPLPMRKGSYEHLPDALLIQIAIFLRLHGARSEDTLRTYTRHLERFCVWMRFAAIRALDENSLMDYQGALLDPPAELLSNDTFSFYPVNEATADQYLAPIRSFLTYLADKNLLAYNPAKFLPRLSISNVSVFDRSKHFADDQWAAVLATLDGLGGDTPGQRNRNERLRFVVLFSYAMGLRVGELLNHTHANIHVVNGMWVLDIVGKGRRARRLSLDELDSVAMDALIRYRRFLKLTPYPSGEPLPLMPTKSPVVTKRKGPNQGQHIKTNRVSDSAWQGLFKDFLRTDVMAHLHPNDAVKQESVYESEWSHLSPHSLRHTRITHMVERGCGLFQVQAFAGHEKLDTTSKYYHAMSRL